MRTLIVVVVLALVALVAYNYVTTGKIAIIPRSLSADQKAVERLEKRFEAARSQFNQAGRAAGISGADTTADAEAARREVERVDAELREMMDRLDGAARQDADRLKAEIDDFKKDLR